MISIRTTSRTLRTTLVVAALGALGACSTLSQGVGSGEMQTPGQSGEQPVLLSWQSQDGGITGSMTATLPGSTYTGPFFQITQQTDQQALDPLWMDWQPGWRDWPYAHMMPENIDSFSTHYTGKVVATLRGSPGAPAMRCRFNLAKPSSGMAGGGQGECQLQGGRVVDATF